jgi:hypothetical protein
MQCGCGRACLALLCTQPPKPPINTSGPLVHANATHESRSVDVHGDKDLVHLFVSFARTLEQVVLDRIKGVKGYLIRSTMPRLEPTPSYAARTEPSRAGLMHRGSRRNSKNGPGGWRKGTQKVAELNFPSLWTKSGRFVIPRIPTERS